jgi:uncharacterized HhH-GPD family protein
MARPILHLAGDPDADAMLSAEPLALLIGMVLDQQIPLEKAFRGPLDLSRRLGTPLDAAALAAMDPPKLGEIFALRPALHRFPGSMAARTQDLCRALVTDYGGDASRVWTEAGDGSDLLGRVRALPGFGEQKARIFVALLGKQFGVRPDGWIEASRPFGDPGTLLSVADIVDAASLGRVREAKAAKKAEARAAKGA